MITALKKLAFAIFAIAVIGGTVSFLAIGIALALWDIMKGFATEHFAAMCAAVVIGFVLIAYHRPRLS